MWKRYTNYEGGTADPMIVSWPRGITKPGECATSTPTRSTSSRRCYECLGVELPDAVKGVHPVPARGHQLRRVVRRRRAPTTGKQTQFYSMRGTRGDLAQRLEGRRRHHRPHPTRGRDFAQQRWELFDTDHDPSECHDVADQYPDKLQELIALWWNEAGKYKPCRSRTVARSRFSVRNGPSSPSRATVTSSTPAAPRCPSR